MDTQTEIVRRPSHSSLASSSPERAWLSKAGYAPPADLSGEGIRYIAMLRRHSKAVLLIFAGGVLASLLVTFFSNPTYKSRTLLEVMAVNQDFMNSKDIDPNTSIHTDDSYIETQMKLLGSDMVADRFVATLEPKVSGYEYRDFGGVAKIRQWLRMNPASPEPPESVLRGMFKNMKIKPEGQSSLISLTVYGPTPELTADAANTVAKQYIDAIQEARWNTATQTGEFLSRQLDSLRTKLQASEDALQEYARQTGIVYTGSDRQSVAEEKLREIQVDLEKAEADRADKQAQLELVHSSTPDALPKVLDDGSLRENKSRLTDLRRQLANLKSTLTPDHYKVIQVQSQIAELESQTETERAAIVKRIQNDYRASARREELLRNSYANQMATVSHQSAKEVRYNILKREVDANRDLYQSMLRKVREASVMAALRASNVRVVDPAKAALTPYQPNLILNSAIGILAGCMFGLLYVLIRERSNQSIRTPGETTRLLDVPELASIPSAKRDICTQLPISSSSGELQGSSGSRLTLIPGRTGESSQKLLSKWAETESLVAESFRSAVTSILLWSRYTGSHQVIVVTSAHAKAGKTTSVFNLGLGLAESGRRVLVIDGDLRRPRLAKLLGFEKAEGLSDILGEARSPAASKSMIRETVMPGLFVLPSGSTKPNVPQLLHSPHLGKLIGQLRSEFDFVLIDSPPSIPLTDSRLFGKHADGVILICLAGETSVDQLLSVRKCFSHDGTHVIGTILNGWNARAENPSYLQSYADYYDPSSVK